MFEKELKNGWSTLLWSSFVFKQVTGNGKSGKSGRGRQRKQEKKGEKTT